MDDKEYKNPPEDGKCSDGRARLVVRAMDKGIVALIFPAVEKWPWTKDSETKHKANREDNELSR